MAHAKPIRLLSVEDHPVFRQGLAAGIEPEPDMLLVAQAANGAEAIAEFRRHRPDVTLMDLRLPGTNGTSRACSAENRTCTSLARITSPTSRSLVLPARLL